MHQPLLHLLTRKLCLLLQTTLNKTRAAASQEEVDQALQELLQTYQKMMDTLTETTQIKT